MDKAPRRLQLSTKRLQLSRFNFCPQPAKAKTKTSAQTALCYLDYLRETLPNGWSFTARHLIAIASHLDAVERGEIDRLAIHMPPRHGKTETVTVRYGAYCIERDPSANVLVTGYNERIARRFSRKSRQIVSSRTKLSKDNAAQDEWSLPEGGTFMARGVGSPPTGVGFKRIIIDDPIRSREDAESSLYRDKAWDWYTDDLYTRLEPKGALIIVSTRWHHDDITARAISSEPHRWTVLNLPAIAEEKDQIGRMPGEALWPERYDVKELGRIKEVMVANSGDYGWSALYQQHPTPREGSFFKSDRITIEHATPNIQKMSRAWDLAATAGSGDYTVGVKMGRDTDGRIWILDVVRGQYDTDQRDKVIRQTAALDGRGIRIRLPQDPGQAGKSQAMHMLRLLHGSAVTVLPVTGAKDVRAEPFASQVAGGNVYMVAADWNRTLLDEMRTFPLGKNDDIVDALTDAYDELVGRGGGWGAV